MNTQPHHYETGGDPAVASVMALWRKIQERPDVQRALAATPRKVVGGPKTADRVKMKRKCRAGITEKDEAEWKRLYFEEKKGISEIARKVGRPGQTVRNHVLGYFDKRLNTHTK